MLAFVLFIGLASAVGALNGSRAARQELVVQQTAQAGLTLQQQYDLALQDIQARQYDFARQRLEYILEQDPNFPGAADQLAKALVILYATATPTPAPPTATPTSPPPTRDMRPVEEQFRQAESLAASEDWSKAIEKLQALRQTDPNYQTARVDGLLWLSLRSRGIQKIYGEANLEGGIYDLALAENFGLIDIEADVARSMARLYLYGLAFWEIYPEKAAYYFGQVAAAMPNFRDSSGWRAIDRYYTSLVQYGDQLFNSKQWCDAKAQYELAANIRSNGELSEKIRLATERCLGITPTDEAAAPTNTPTPTFPVGPTPTFTATQPGPPAPSDTPTQPAPQPSDTPTNPPPPSDTPPPPPSDTPAPPTETKANPPPYPLSPPQPGNLGGLLPWLFLPVAMAAFRQGAAQPQPGKPKPAQDKKTGRKLALTVFLVLVLAAATALAGWGAYTVSHQLSLRWLDFISLSGPKLLEGSATPTGAIPGTLSPDSPTLAPTQAEIAASLKPWDGAGRVTVLLLGLDYRDWSASEPASRSDTMILLTLDPQAKTAGILSVPRDMWVSIPGFTRGKINTAYYLGDIYEMPGGGPALAVKTVEQFLGIEINYFAQIDFGAFVRFIDEIGGVEVDVPQEITVDLLGTGFKTKKTLKAGRQVLPGEWALAYARARHTEGGDFDRAFRQQQVIMAIRDRMISADRLPTIISKAPALYSELASGIRTNLTLDQVIQLALLAQTIPDEKIERGIIGKESVIFGTSSDGLAILLPIPDKIHLLRERVFAGTDSLGPLTTGTPAEMMQAEQASIALFDGSSVADLLNRTSNYLRGLGISLGQIGTADQRYTVTTIIDHTGNPYTVKYLVDLLRINPNKIYFKFDPNSPTDVEIFLGLDWARNNTLP